MGLIAFAFGAWICGVALSGASGAAADGAAPAGLVGRDIGVPQTATGLPILGRSVASTVQKRACPGNTKSCTISGTAYCVPTNYVRLSSLRPLQRSHPITFPQTCCATTLCGPGQTCGSNGICLGTCAQTTCPLASGGSACVDISIDYRACGGCGKTCGQPMGGFGYCEDGKCMVACDPGFAHQNGSCIQGGLVGRLEFKDSKWLTSHLQFQCKSRHRRFR